MYDGDENDLQTIIDNAEAWYLANRVELLNPSCCGKYTGGFTGNTNCDELGAMNLQDVTRLIDRIYLSKTELCCEENGDTNGDGAKNLQDVTRLIDHIYLSKNPTAACP